MKPLNSPNPINLKEALNVLSAWTALEVLSPNSFRRPEELNNNDIKSVILFQDEDDLPWEGEINLPPDNKNIFYQVIIGTLDLEKCMEALIEKYGDEDIEIPPMKGEAVIGLVVVDIFGCPVIDKKAVSLSSFAWGVPQALSDNLKTLSEWPSQENEILEEFNKIFFPEGCSLPLNKNTLNLAYDFLVETLKIPLDLANDRKFGLRIYKTIKKDKKDNKNKENKKEQDASSFLDEGRSPWPLLINSFFLKDLALAKDLILKGEAPQNFLRYLGVRPPAERDSVLENYPLLEEILAPKNIPVSRWPGKGRHPLVLKQQAAVNLSMSTLEEGGILGINGPPGTGKTTLLRDIVAGIVTKRAEALLKFNDPEKAFIKTKCEVPAGSATFNVYEIDKSLKGFEILIASSNNKAVENISAELPGLEAIADDADELRYFKTLSDSLLGDESWGLISAVLGNSSNRYHFCKKFWRHKDVGIFHYFQEILKKDLKYKLKNYKTDEILSQIPQIIQDCDPPAGHSEALKRWDRARKRFINALRKVQDKLNDLQDKRDSIYLLQSFQKTLKEGQDLKALTDEHQASQPHFFAKLFRLPSTRNWHKESKRLILWRKLINTTEPYFKSLGPHLVDVDLFLKTHQQYNQISPWCDKDVQILRDNVFIEAMKLHKAFIDAAAQPLKHNLGIWTLLLGVSKNSMDKELLDLIPNIWSSFFLVVPSISTTFASTNSMLNCLPSESLGWLIIDEAGQAVPQAALGAILKTKRAIVTGDPLQIEPVITLPPKLTKSIFQQFDANAAKFNPPKASVQTLADEASCYFAEIPIKNGSRLIGFPLLVHRRCTSPMFEISNRIAYENLMVHAKTSQSSQIRNCLGYSTWFDIESEGEIQDKWCPKEGEKVLDLLWELKVFDIFPDLYIITPFKIVATFLRAMILDSKVLESWDDIDPELWINDNIGTVHTVQGREAEAVILVLGAPLSSQAGSREWAGSTPNLLNVAVTRAREVLYVIGNKDLWKNVGVFEKLNSHLDLVAHKHELKKHKFMRSVG